MSIGSLSCCVPVWPVQHSIPDDHPRTPEVIFMRLRRGGRTLLRALSIPTAPAPCLRSDLPSGCAMPPTVTGARDDIVGGALRRRASDDHCGCAHSAPTGRRSRRGHTRTGRPGSDFSHKRPPARQLRELLLVRRPHQLGNPVEQTASCERYRVVRPRATTNTVGLLRPGRGGTRRDQPSGRAAARSLVA